MPRDAESLFNEARGLPPESRSNFLDEACADEPALRARVEALLDADDPDATFLRTAAPDGETLDAGAAVDPDATLEQTRQQTPRRTNAEVAGQRIDGYTLISELGAGGFGTVWVADQSEPVRRRVALKIIKLGMDTEQVMARFEAERQALALMDHPSIAKVFDAGATESGRPYFVMEYIRGVSIVEFCNQHQLGTEARLRLFVQVCAAIQHAHQKGVVHRDIKPGNVLVTEQDGVAVPKVIDFGIAKATSAELTQRTLLTEEQQIIGTPAYMAPEQAGLSDLDIDTRCDIYSLGVLLYELLTGTTPFETSTLMEAGLVEMLRVIREEEPAKPSTRLMSLGDSPTTVAAGLGNATRLGTALRGDLDWIVMKCLEKDRARRYESASGLADDIARHLANQAVLAGPPSASYRIRKFVRRNRAGVIVGGLLLGLLIAGAVGTSYGMVWALDEKGRAEKAERETQRELTRVREVKRLITGMLQGVTPEIAQGADTSVLEEILAGTERRLANGQVEDPLIEAEIRTLLGQIYANLGRREQGEAETQAALKLWHANTPETDRRRLSAEVQAIWIEVVGTTPDTIERGEQLLARLDALLEPDDPITVRLMITLGQVYSGAQRFDDAAAIIATARERAGTMDGEMPLVAVDAISALAGVYSEQTRLEDAERLRRQALSERVRLQGETHPSTVIERMLLAKLYTEQGRYIEAEPLHRESVEALTRVMGEDHRRTLMSQRDLADALAVFGKLDEALVLLDDLIEQQSEAFGIESTDALLSRISRADANIRLVRFQQAADEFEEIREAVVRVFGEDDERSHHITNKLGVAYGQLGRHEEALPLLRAAHAANLRRLGPDHPATLSNGNDLGLAAFVVEDLEEAERVFRQTNESHERVLGPDHPDTLTSKYNLGLTLARLSRLESAERVHREVLEARERVLGEDHPYTTRSVVQLASVLVQQRKTTGLLPLAERGFDQAQRTLGDESPDTLEAARVLFQVLMQRRDMQRALEVGERQLELSIKVAGEETQGTLGDMTNLAIIHLRMMNVPRAIELLERSVPLKRRVLGDAHQFTKIAMANLMQAYRIAGRTDDLQAMSKEFMEMQLAVVDAMNPPQVEHLNSAAWMLLTYSDVALRDPGRALTYARRAYELDLADGRADNGPMLDTYARALAETGDLPGAIEMQRLALERTPESDPTYAEILTQLEAYQAQLDASEPE